MHTQTPLSSFVNKNSHLPLFLSAIPIRGVSLNFINVCCVPSLWISCRSRHRSNGFGFFWSANCGRDLQGLQRTPCWDRSCFDYWKQLFSMINDLPTDFEVVTEKKNVKEKSSADSANKSRGTKRSCDSIGKSKAKPAEESYEEDEDEHNEMHCGRCRGRYNADEFWIGCDICERWFHGKCVKITPAKAENIKQYKCRACVVRGR